MEFGKLTDISLVDFSLPDEPPQNGDVFSTLPPNPSEQHIYLGATGYNMKPWVGNWYALGSKEKDFLRQYGRQFNTIEHNTTHYRIPDETTILRWKEEVPDDFRYAPKIPQIISHARDLGVGSDFLREFCENIKGLGPKLGCCFLQLPPYFDTSKISMLERFLKAFPSTIPLAVEVRHESFFEATVEAEYFFQLLTAYCTSAVITDVAGRRDVCHCRITNATTLVRFVGNGLHSSDYTRIEAWAERLQQWFQSGLQTAYFFTHEPDNLLAPDLAKFAATIFSDKMPGIKIRGPQEMAKQATLF